MNPLASLSPAHKESQVAAFCEGDADTDHDLHEGAVAYLIVGDAVIRTLLITIGSIGGIDRVSVQDHVVVVE